MSGNSPAAHVVSTQMGSAENYDKRQPISKSEAREMFETEWEQFLRIDQCRCSSLFRKARKDVMRKSYYWNVKTKPYIFVVVVFRHASCGAYGKQRRSHMNKRTHAGNYAPKTCLLYIGQRSGHVVACSRSYMAHSATLVRSAVVNKFLISD